MTHHKPPTQTTLFPLRELALERGVTFLRCRREMSAGAKEHHEANHSSCLPPFFCDTLDLVRLADGSIWIYAVPCSADADEWGQYPRLINPRFALEIPLDG